MKSLLYHFLVVFFRIGLFFWHPVFRVIGREKIPENGRLMICANHSGMADPIWIVFALREKTMPKIMAKKELMGVPIVGAVLKTLEIIPVERGGNDIAAIKASLKALMNEERMMVFPEGTRWKPGKKMEAKRGALMLAARTETPLLPIYLQRKRFPFSPLKCIIGDPYLPVYSSRKPSDEELQAAADDLMRKIYSMGGDDLWK